MKYFVTACLITLLLPVIGIAQQSSWQWVNPLPQGNIINGVWTISQDTAVAVANDGTILRTSNGGLTWQVEYNAGGVVDPLYAVQFVNSKTGWAVGESGSILKTTDGGATWAQQPLTGFDNLFGTWFSNSTTGWAVGLFGSIIKTTDGGASWFHQNGNTSATLYTIYFRTPTRGWAVGSNGVIISTTDGGTTWKSDTSHTAQSLYSISFISDSVGFVSGAFGTMLKTTNGGRTWVVTPTATSFSLYSIHFVSSLLGIACGAYGEIIRTTDGGSTWVEQTSGSYNDLFAVRFSSSSAVWAMGDFGTILRSTDGGVTWLLQSTGVQNTLNGMHFPSLSNGWVVGDEGTIAHSSDGGLSWNLQSSRTALSLYNVHMVNDLIGWAVGDSAIILKTTNGGVNWFDQNSHTDITLYSVAFSNPILGWAAGDAGTILHTVNGLTWTAQATNTAEALVKVAFYDANLGYAVGMNGTILKTLNGGTTWTQLLSNTTATLYGISILNPSTVVIAGDYGLVLKTTDGGGTWNQQVVDMVTSYYGLTFYSQNLGWAVGDDGEIIGTMDGGNSWALQNSGTNNTLWDVQLVPTSSGGGVTFASGVGGTILYSTVSPLPIRTWTGAFDSNWTNAANWSPIGVPDKGDSIVITAATFQPVHRLPAQQINIAALQINAGAKLTLRNGLAQLAVKGSINIDGTLEIDPSSMIEVLCDGNFSLGSAGVFKPGHSSVVFGYTGTLRGTFYDLFIGNGAVLHSAGNINVLDVMTTFGQMIMAGNDSLKILNRDPQAVLGTGIIQGGTVVRSIMPAATTPYRFESPSTTVKFYPVGTLPDTVSVSTGYYGPPGFADSLFVRRHYTFTAKGGSSFLYQMIVRYDTTESTIPIDNLAFFRDSSGILINIPATDYSDSTDNILLLDSLRSFWSWYLGKATFYPVHPYQFFDTLIMVNGTLQADSAIFGAFPGATDGIDYQLGEYPLPPLPAPSVQDLRFMLDATTGSLMDIKDVVTIGHPHNIYRFHVQPGSSGYPVTVKWSVNALPPGSVLMKDSATAGATLTVDMKQHSSVVLTGPAMATLLIDHKLPPIFPYLRGWNIASLPIKPFKSNKKIDLFPTAISRAFEYSGNYRSADTMVGGKGYWLKFPADQGVALDGENLTADTISVSTGWNLIGALASTIPTASIIQSPPGIITSKYFGYRVSYFMTDTLGVAKGYWIKTNAPGKLYCSIANNLPQAAVVPADDGLRGMNTIAITDGAGNDQMLYFGSGLGDPALYELPPVPPEGIFDARFASGRLADRLETAGQGLDVLLQAAVYPVTVTWHVAEPSVRSLTITAGRSPVPVVSTASRDGSVKISDRSVTQLTLRGSDKSPAPRSFALRQNYPNPFNPSTVIAFDLPEGAQVTLRVFNLLGQQVASLAENVRMEAGTHSFTFLAPTLGSGVYFYQLTAQSTSGQRFGSVRKMMLLR